MVGKGRDGDEAGGRVCHGLCGGEGAATAEIISFSVGGALVGQVDDCAV